jgi:hypothetical protein
MINVYEMACALGDDEGAIVLHDRVRSLKQEFALRRGDFGLTPSHHCQHPQAKDGYQNPAFHCQPPK